MKKYLTPLQCQVVLSGLVALSAAVPVARADDAAAPTAHADDALTKSDDSESKWQISASANVLFNISAHFSGHPSKPALGNPNELPGAVNYDNGYVGRDVSGDPNFSTYWGYNQASQQVISGGNVTGLNYQRTTASGGGTSPDKDSGASPGAEITLRREITEWGPARFGLELGADYNHAEMKDSSGYYTSGDRTTYSYGFPTPVQTGLFPPPGYQGPFNGAGLNINPTGTTGQTISVANAVYVTGNRDVTADLFGFRFGPYVELPITKRFNVSLSAGALVALVYDSVTWSENLSVNTATATGYWTGSSSASDNSVGVTAGVYVGGTMSYQLSKDWSVLCGVRFQDAGTYSHDIGAGKMDLNLGHAISANLGVGYSF